MRVIIYYFYFKEVVPFIGDIDETSLLLANSRSGIVLYAQCSSSLPDNRLHDARLYLDFRLFLMTLKRST